MIHEVEMIQGKIIRVRWVMINEGSSAQPVIRCRLVAMEFESNEVRDDLFAGTPSLYAG